MKFNVDIKGLAELQKTFLEYGKGAEKKFSDITERSGDLMVKKAKDNIKAYGIYSEGPREGGRILWDTGFMINSIAYEMKDKLRARIFVGAHYGAYQEFGTGNLTSIPEELIDEASRFKKDGGGNINIPARPFLYPAYLATLPIYKRDLERGIQELNQKYG